MVKGGLALVLVLNQFPRQIRRAQEMGFCADSWALALSQQGVAKDWPEADPEQARRQFWLMTLKPREVLTVQEAAPLVFERFSDPRTADVARRHRDGIALFGRFPHRNAALGQVSNAEALAYLRTPGSCF
jgi:uncharacterized protein (DUF924 family)